MGHDTCPLCRTELTQEIRALFGDSLAVACVNCGTYDISRSALTILQEQPLPTSQGAMLSHAVRRSTNRPLVTTDFINTRLTSASLPDANDILNNLLLYLATELGGPGEKIDLQAINLRAVLGTTSSTGVNWAFEQAMGLGLLVGTLTINIPSDNVVKLMGATLTIKGWERVHELKKEAKDSRKAFMAMKFGDPELDAVFREHFKPAVKQTGFTLQRLDDEPRAGLIDDRMRLAIRTSRVLIADLTHGNAGAYWEAGYAEGLGRPVIYTCRKDVFDDPERRPHFDTNHHLTVVWDADAIEEAVEQMKAVIRVTLPADAFLEDTGTDDN
jgi:hypothetical protein